MKTIYAFVDDSAISEISPVLKELGKEKDLEIKCFNFLDKQVFEPNLLSLPDCFLVVFNESSKSVKIAERLVLYCIEQHLKLIPVILGNDVDCSSFPAILSSLHILKSNDTSIVGKLLFAINSESENMNQIYKKIQTIDHLWKNEERAHLTAQELFIYSLALLYGIEVETEYNTSMLLQMCLFGNESFEPQMIKVGVIPKNIVDYHIVMEYAESLKQYIDAEINNIEQMADFGQTEKLLSYGYLLMNIGSNLIFGLHVDDVLRSLNRISALKCKSDPSVKSGRWVLKNYWEASGREARNRYYDKMLDNLLEILFYADIVLRKHSDFDIKLYLFQAASVLGIYNALKPEILNTVINTKILDTYQKIDSFRPPHEIERRSVEESHIMRDLQVKYACNMYISIDLFFAKDDICQKQEQLLQVVANTVDLLLLCKCNCVSDSLSVWFHKNMQILADSIPLDDQIKHVKLLSGYSSFLQNLLNAPYASDLEALQYAALHMEAFYDRCETKCLEFGLDKSEIYSVLAEVYKEKKKHEKYDYYIIKLFEIVSVRDYNNSEAIIRMLVQCYNTAAERLEQSLYEQVKLYIRFGWNCCKAYNPLPKWLETAYIRFRDAATDLDIK